MTTNRKPGSKPASKAGAKPAGNSGTRAANKSARDVAHKVLMKVLTGSSLSSLQAVTIDALPDKRDRGLASELVYGVLRHYWQIDYLLSCLLSKPLKSKDDDIRLHLLLGLYELWQCRTPDYAVVNETVNKVRKSRKKWAASMINAVLRRFEREKQSLEQ